MIRLIQRHLIIPRGDTGKFTLPVTASIDTGDVAIFTIFNLSTRKKLFTKIVNVTSNTIAIEFSHSDTVNLPVGKYVWDVKFYKNATIDEDGQVINGDEVDSYYSAYTLPVCEIRPTGDLLLTADDAPTSTVNPEQLNVITSAASLAQQSAQAAAEAAETAIAALSSLTDLTVDITTLSPDEPATGSYDHETGILSLGLPQGKDGVGVQSVVQNSDSSITITDTEGNAYTTQPLKGDAYILTSGDEQEIAGITQQNIRPIIDYIMDIFYREHNLLYILDPYNEFIVKDANDHDTVIVKGPSKIEVDMVNANEGWQRIYLPVSGLQEPFQNGHQYKFVLKTNNTANVSLGIVDSVSHEYVDNGTISIDDEKYTTFTYNENNFINSTPQLALVIKFNGTYTATGKYYFYDITNVIQYATIDDLNGKADKADTVLLTSLSRGRAEDTIIGEASFAFGHGVIASGLASHAEGSNTTASAASTHAEGDSNVASASCAHVEGQSNTASGSYSHAEGRGTIASASGAHTEGNYTTANNGYAHAEGSYTVAKGECSHAEGYQAEASAYASHAEGNATVASSDQAHAEGDQTIASGTSSHAEGKITSATGYASHSEGAYTAASNLYSHAEGYMTYAKGTSSHAEGVGTGINGTHQFRDGSRTAIGAVGEADHTEGYFTSTVSDGAHTNYGNHAEGYETVAGSTTRQTQGAHAEGQQSVAQNTAAHAEGYRTTASGYSSHTEGVGAIASAQASHAEGNATTASGADSHAEGGGTAARGAQAHAEGAGSIASGAAAHAEGAATLASKDAAHAEGSYSIANGIAAHAEGDTTIATGTAVHAGGKFNVDLNANNVTMAQIIGNGTKDSNRSNAYALSWEGDGYYNGDVYVNCDANSANGTKVATVNDLSDLSDSVAATYYTKPSGGIPATDLAETYITTETDPTVPAWAKAAQKPTYTAAEVGATTEQQVSSMIADAIGDIHSFDMAVVQALPTQDISTHTIYLVPKTGETNDVYDEYIYVNNAWEMIGNTQVDLSDYALKSELPTKTSDLTNDSGFLTSYTETDPTVPQWAKTATKPSYTAAEVGALPDNTHIPSTTAELTNDAGFITDADVPTKISDLTNDSDFMRQYYGVCNTDGATAAKQVTISNLSEITTGTTILVKFNAANTASNPKLEINGGDQIPIYRGTSAVGTSANTSWPVGSVVQLTYDGTNWVIDNYNNTTYNNMTDAQVIAGTSTSGLLISPTRVKLGVETHAPVKSVNGQTGTVQLNAVEYGNFQNLTAAEQQMALANLGLSNEALPISDDLYKSRVVSGGEKVKIEKIVGGTVAFNQIAPNFASGNGWSTSGCGLTWDNDNHSTTATVSSSGVTNGYAQIYRSDLSRIPGHKYLTSVQCTVTSGTPQSIVLTSGSSSYSLADAITTVSNNTWYTLAGIINQWDDHTATVACRVNFTSATLDDTFQVKNLMEFDLTQMFGANVADYIYGLETTTAGAGVAFFRTLFPDAYYPYNAGELVSVAATGRKTVGFNLWDEEWEVGTINSSTGVNASSALSIRAKNQIPVLAGKTYCLSAASYSHSGNVPNLVVYYDASGNFVSSTGIGQKDTNTFIVPQGVAYMRFVKVYYIEANGTYKHDICLNISDPARDGQYEPYSTHTYPLDNTLTLRGIPVLTDDDKVVYDGDQYAPDGTVMRRYMLIPDLGALSWTYSPTNGIFYAVNSALMGVHATYQVLASRRYDQSKSKYGANFAIVPDKIICLVSSQSNLAIKDTAYSDSTEFTAAVSGISAVVALATPTTESADPYAAVQDAGTTEEFLGTSVPVGVKDCYYCAQSIADVKADKVQNATSGNFAALDANGNLTDSGHKHSDYLTAHQDLSNYVQKTDYATDSVGGVVKVNSLLGIGTYANILTIMPASDVAIKAGDSSVAPIVAENAYKATFYGLAKAAGDSTQASSSNAVGTYTNEAKAAIRSMIGAAASADVGVQDVQVDSTSIVTNGVANIPAATTQTLGLVKTVGTGNGLALLPDGTIYVWRAQSYQIKAGGGQYNPIMPAYQHESVFYGLAKAAGADMKDSDNAVGTYTDAAKGAIQKMLGVTDLFGNEENDVTATRAYAVGEAFVSNGKLYRATAAIAKDGAIVTDGSVANCEEISITEDFVKKTDYATSSTAGVVKTSQSYGTTMSNGALAIAPASNDNMKGGTNAYKPIVPAKQDQAVFYGLAKVAGADLASETVTLGTYPDAAKTAIKSMLGITDSFPATSSLTDDFYSVKVTSGTSTLVKETVDARAYGVDAGGTGDTINVELQRNRRIVYGEMVNIQIMTVPSYGLCGFTFISGTTPTVLTLPNTVVMPEWWTGTIETSRRYNIMFLDGHGAVMSWPL